MAAPKTTDPISSELNRKVMKRLFRNSQISPERKREWLHALQHTATDTVALRFPCGEGVAVEPELRHYVERLLADEHVHPGPG